MENKYSIKSFYIPKNYLSIFEVLERYCERKGESKSYIICEAVKEYLERQLELELEGRKSPFKKEESEWV